MLDSVALKNSPVRLHAPEKSGKGALEDERANWTASSQLEGDMLRLAQQSGRSIAKQLSGQVPADRLGALIACQPNLHNGALHLGAHLDWPLHEGFGICIATVAIKGGGNVLLLGGEGDEDEDGNQPAWKFRVEEGECYILSGRARDRCLHGVVADDGGRESLNLRFGLHTAQQAHSEIIKHWPEAMESFEV
jgi:hypothetical protein